MTDLVEFFIEITCLFYVVMCAMFGYLHHTLNVEKDLVVCGIGIVCI